jgi:hypothetical protein
MRLVESVFVFLFSALASMSWIVFISCICLTLCSRKTLISWLHSSGFFSIFSFSSRGMRIVNVVDIYVFATLIARGE